MRNKRVATRVPWAERETWNLDLDVDSKAAIRIGIDLRQRERIDSTKAREPSPLRSTKP